MANHRAPRRRTMWPDTAPPHLAYTSLALAVVGFVGAAIPGDNLVTGLAATVGLALGFVGIWISRQVMSGLAAVLCGTAVVMSLVVQHYAEKDAQQRMDEQQHRYELNLPIRDVGAGVIPDGC